MKSRFTSIKNNKTVFDLLTSKNVQRRHKTSKDGKRRHKTSQNVRRRQKTSQNVTKRQKTAKHGKRRHKQSKIKTSQNLNKIDDIKP